VNAKRILDMVSEQLNLSPKTPCEIAASRNVLLRLEALVPEFVRVDFSSRPWDHTLFGIPFVVDSSVPEGEIHLRYNNWTGAVIDIREEVSA
jgi:hypothetical protein